MNSTDSHLDPWAALAQVRLAALYADGSHPSRADLESEVILIREALRPFLGLLNRPPHAPLLALPDETLIEILLYVRDIGLRDRTPRCENRDHRNVATWYSFTHVCHRIRNIALGAPVLWTDVSDLDGSRLLKDFSSRSKGMPISLRLRDTRPDKAVLHRIKHLRITTPSINNTHRILQHNFPALETLYVDTSSFVDISERQLPSISEEFYPPRLHSMHLVARGFPWDSLVYNNLTELVLSDIMSRALSFTLVQVQILFSRMRRVEKIVMRDVDIQPTLAHDTDTHIELPTMLRTMRLGYTRSFIGGNPRLPLHVRPRLGVYFYVSLLADALGNAPAYRRALLTRHVFGQSDLRPSKIRIRLTPVNGDRYHAIVGYWCSSATRHSEAPILEIQCPFESQGTDSLGTGEEDFLLDQSKEHVTTLSLYLDQSASELPIPDLDALSGLLLAHSSVHTVNSTARSFAHALSSVQLPLDTNRASDRQLGGLHTLHLRADPLDSDSKAVEHLVTIARWLHAREDVGLTHVDVHLDEKLMKVLRGDSAETWRVEGTLRSMDRESRNGAVGQDDYDELVENAA